MNLHDFHVEEYGKSQTTTKSGSSKTFCSSCSKQQESWTNSITNVVWMAKLTFSPDSRHKTVAVVVRLAKFSSSIGTAVSTKFRKMLRRLLSQTADPTWKRKKKFTRAEKKHVELWPKSHKNPPDSYGDADPRLAAAAAAAAAVSDVIWPSTVEWPYHLAASKQFREPREVAPEGRLSGASFISAKIRKIRYDPAVEIRKLLNQQRRASRVPRHSISESRISEYRWKLHEAVPTSIYSTR